MTKRDTTALARGAQRRLAVAGERARPTPRDPLRHARRALADLGREQRFAHLRRMYD